MYFVATREIQNPLTLEILATPRTVLTIEAVYKLIGVHGVDSLECVLCPDMGAVERVLQTL